MSRINHTLTPGAIIVALNREKELFDQNVNKNHSGSGGDNKNVDKNGKKTSSGSASQFGLDLGKFANKLINRGKKKNNTSGSSSSSSSSNNNNSSGSGSSSSNMNSITRSMKPQGICGLTNMGNTCFMAAGLQCLAHTPLLLLYFLSGRYKKELNKKNILGTGGKLTEEYVSLLHTLYNSGNAYSTPSKFKKVLSKCKQQFVGYEQQVS